MIVAFVQTKGGTGKSTLALNVAYSKYMRKEFPSIALVELDPQGTLKKWWSRREQNGHKKENIVFHHISSEDKDEILEEIEMLENENELLILDVPGESIGKFHTKFACAVSDLVLIPMRTSTNDEEAFEDNLMPIIKKIIDIDQESRDVFYIVPSFTHPLANKANVLEYFEEIMPDYVHCLPAVFSFGSVFENFSRGGNNLIEYGESVKANAKLYDQAKKAINEVEAIAKEIIQISSN
ncbi:MAG: ParA family protein [Proteobacteria bacterium]|nr:ParA family protein [Pseudomonadota bacterium]